MILQLALLLLTLQPDASEPAVSFDELVEGAAAFDGEDIVLEGWFRGCFGERCAVFRAPEGPDHRSLTISRTSPAYAAVKEMPAGRVQVTARFDATCVLNPCLGGPPNTLTVTKIEPIREE